MKKVAFIGVGIMGKSMVRHLMKAGFELHIFARTPEKVADVVSEGAVFHASIGDCVKDCDAVITMVGFPTDVEEVYFAPQNILDSAKAGAYLIDMTTSSPTLAEKIYAEGTARGYHVIDAPVTGGEIGAAVSSNGHEHQLPRRGGVRPACETSEPDYDCRDTFGHLRSLDVCQNKEFGFTNVFAIGVNRGCGQQAAGCICAKNSCGQLRAGFLFKAFCQGYEAGTRRSPKQRGTAGCTSASFGTLRSA